MSETLHTTGIDPDSPHYGHLFDYNERALISRKVERIVIDANGYAIILPEDTTPEVESISESFLYCITCGVQITADDLGAEEWEVA